MKLQHTLLLIISAVLLFVLFYWLNTKDYAPRAYLERDMEEFKTIIKNLSQIDPVDFRVHSLEHFNDSVYSSIGERLADGPQLVFYIPGNACQDCILMEYGKLKLLPAFMQDKIIIMTSYEKRRDVKMWMNARQYIYPVYNDPVFGMTEFGSKNHLTLFVINESGIPCNFFFPKTTYPEMSDEYYNFMILKFRKAYGVEPDPATQSEEKAEVSFNNKHNFGTLKPDERVTTTFEFENLSAVPFIITEVKTNCGCTVPEWDRIPSGEGEKTKVKVDFHAEREGYFSKKITVFSNAKDSPHVLTITGKVE